MVCIREGWCWKGERAKQASFVGAHSGPRWRGGLAAFGSGGHTWLKRIPELQPVGFGQQVEISATASMSATIFASTGMSRPPSCDMITENGDPVTVGEVSRYVQGGGLESAFGFPMTSGTTYVVTCRGEAPEGCFAVAPDVAVPEGIFIAAGSLGLLMCVVGIVLAARQRQRP